MKTTYLNQLLPWHIPYWQQWQHYLALDNIPHALLLAGPHGLGKQQFAHYLSQSLVCQSTTSHIPCGHCQSCHQVITAQHPAIHCLAPEDKYITIEAIRNLIDKTHLTTKSWQIFLIRSADTMHPAAANALLKTLEEPTPNTLILLTSAAPQRLPATIRSRSQKILFSAAETTSALQWLQQQPKVDWQPLLALSSNAPLAAIQAFETSRLNDIQQLVEHFTQLRANKSQLSQIVALLTKRPILQVFDDITCICYDIARLSVQNTNTENKNLLFLPTETSKLSTLAQHICLSQLLHFIDQLHQLQSQLQHNLNPTIVLEQLILHWLTLT